MGGNFAEAKELYRKVTQDMEKMVGVSKSALKSDQSAWLNNLGSCLLAQGKLDEAEKCVNEARQISQDFLGEKDPETLKILDNLASVLFAKKDKKGAVMYLTEVAKGYEEAYGAWHA